MRPEGPSRRWLHGSILAVALAALGGCSRKPPPNAATGTVAEEATWIEEPSAGVRVKVPPGFHLQQRGPIRVAESSDAQAAIALASASTSDQVEADLRFFGSTYSIEEVEFDRPRQVQLHGIDAVIFEDMGAVARGAPADVLILIGDAPSGDGVVLLMIVAADASQLHDLALIEAANSLRAK
jgi:hypothetical protein